QLVEQAVGLLGELGLERVLRLAGHVDGDHRDAVVADLQLEHLVGLVRHRNPILRHQATSSTMAAPRPPAAQAVTSASPPPRRRSSLSVCTIMRPPVAANGWP